MLSVIGIADTVHTGFASLQKGVVRAVTFKMDVNSKSNMQVELDQSLDTESSTHGDISSMFPSDDCRFGFFNLDYMEGLGKRSKLIFVLWVPSDAKVKAKMVYASCAVPLKAKLGITCMSAQGGDLSLLDYDELVEKCRKHYN